MNLPWKIKCFIWLCLNHRIMTSDSLQSRGFSRPGRCVLYLSALEPVEHLFGDCIFFQEAWLFYCCCINQPWKWGPFVVEGNLKLWVKDSLFSLVYPLVIMWEVWRACNSILFQMASVDIKSICLKACTRLVDLRFSLLKANSRHINYPLFNDN